MHGKFEFAIPMLKNRPTPLFVYETREVPIIFALKHVFSCRKETTHILHNLRQAERAVVLQNFFRQKIAASQRPIRHAAFQPYNRRQRKENDSVAMDRATCARELQRLYRGHHTTAGEHFKSPRQSDGHLSF